jgi:hypothetical protein
METQMRKILMLGGAMAMTLALLPGAALAQDDAASDDMMGMVPHPSHIHVGSCPAPGDVVAPLSDVTVVGNDAQGAEEHVHVDIGLSTVELPLEAILADDHAFVVHASADDMGTYLVCGNIGGNDVNGSFVVGLGAVGDSGYSGIGWLTDNGDGTTDVQLAISHSGATESMGMDDDDMADDDMSDDDMSEDAMATDDMSDDSDEDNDD